MHVTTIPEKLHFSGAKTSINAHELVSAFNQYAPEIKILSLDCFDTIIWRKTADPKDVFYDLEQKPTFKALGFSALMRIKGESLAYRINQVKQGITQAYLDDIYRASFPKITNEQLTALAEEELAAEMEACYAFPPVLELIRAAHAKDKKIIIVSDTYFNSAQLLRLLESKLPADILAAIDKIICSCDKGKAKADGLFRHVIDEMKLSPEQILHIGDNPIADFTAPRALGLNALHLLHYKAEITELMRMQAASASFIDPSIRTTRSLPNLFRGLLASKLNHAEAESLIGYASLGPIMFAFAKFIHDEVEQMQCAGKRPKVLFLLRDAYLPALALEALLENPIGSLVRISRFSAYAASFRSKDDVERYLAEKIHSGRYADMCKQLLLPDHLQTIIMNQLKKANKPQQEFIRLITKPNTLQIIFEQSSNYLKRLQKYLEKSIDLEQDDTLVFVDLGYTGTAQVKLEPIFREEMNVDIVGRYLIALRTPNWQTSRKGLIDPTLLDDKALVMLVTYIALLEQLCTSTDSSVVDFDAEGNPLLSEAVIDEHQHNKVKSIQAECIRFIQDAKQFLNTVQIHPSSKMLCDTAAISLARLIYLPTKSELEYLQTLQFDFNLGTQEKLPIFDLNKGISSLRRRSWLNCAKENMQHMRMNYPAEWRAANLELSLTLMAQHRFGLEFVLDDLSLRREKLQVLVQHEQDASLFAFDAQSTQDGYYGLLIPITSNNIQIGIQFGLNYDWVEIESAELIHFNRLFTQSESEYTIDASPYLIINKMNDKGGGLFECLSESGMLIFAPAKNLPHESYILRVTFRPIVKK